jgi:hypothetical protein
MAGGSYSPFTRTESTYGVFGKLLLEQVSVLRTKLRHRDQPLLAAWGIASKKELEEKLSTFQESIEDCTRRAEESAVSKADNPLFFRLRQAFVLGNIKELAADFSRQSKPREIGRSSISYRVVSCHKSIATDGPSPCWTDQFRQDLSCITKTGGSGNGDICRATEIIGPRSIFEIQREGQGLFPCHR